MGWGLLAAALIAALAAQLYPLALSGSFGDWQRLADPDAYARLLRVLQLASAGDWFNSTLHAVAAPEGLSLHWTRPLDVILLLLAAPLLLFLPLTEAVYWAGVGLGPLLLLWALWMIVWWARAQVTPAAVFISVLLLILQPSIVAVLNLGEADHHGLLICLSLFALVLIQRGMMLSESQSDRYFIGAGVAAGLGLWVSIEFVTMLLPLVFALWLHWCLTASASIRSLELVSRGCWMVVLLALLVERLPSEWLSVSYDRISIVHGVFCLLLWAGAKGLQWLCRNADHRVLWYKLLISALIGVVALGLQLWLFPDLLKDPMGNVSDYVRSILLPQIAAEKGVLQVHAFKQSFLKVFIELGPLLWVIPFVGWQLWRGDAVTRRRFLIYAVLLGLLIPLTLFAKSRALVMLQVVMLLPLIELVDAFFRRMLLVFRAGSVLSGLLHGVGLIVVVGLPWIVTGSSVVAQQQPVSKSLQECRYDDVGKSLGSLLAHDETLISDIFDGPELAWYTGRGAVAGPYHRNEKALLDIDKFMKSSGNDEPARQVAADRKVGMVVLCLWLEKVDIARLKANPRGLQARLLEGYPPPWLRPVRLPAEQGRTVLAYRVVRSLL